MPLSKICDVVVTSAAEGEFSVDCTDHMVHMKAGSPAELQLWLGSLREVAAVNTRRAAEEAPQQEPLSFARQAARSNEMAGRRAAERVAAARAAAAAAKEAKEAAAKEAAARPEARGEGGEC